jgi:hypothetical protein
MNSLHFLSRQLDEQFASHAATPPSTPIRDAVNELLRDDATRPLRTKSYARIAPGRSLDPRGHQAHVHDRTPPWGLPPQQQLQKRSYSSPALWSFRKTSSPTPSLTPPPQPASPNGTPSSCFPQVEESRPISEQIEHAHVSVQDFTCRLGIDPLTVADPLRLGCLFAGLLKVGKGKKSAVETRMKRVWKRLKKVRTMSSLHVRQNVRILHPRTRTCDMEMWLLLSLIRPLLHPNVLLPHHFWNPKNP